MKFVFATHDPDFQLGIQQQTMNGGTAPQWHLSHTLEAMGHDSRLVRLDDDSDWDVDFVFVQSEWYSAVQDKLAAAKRKGAKVIVWVGHFKGVHYYDPKLIDADFYVTTWKGKILTSVPYGQRILYFPHAYCDVCDYDTEVQGHQMIWFGNKYPLRDESWFDGLPVTRLNAIMPNLLGSYYRRSTICPNLHGDFQKGIVSTHDASIADLPGLALNERLFAVPGAGGFEVCDWSPLIDETYADDEVVKCKTAAEFHDQVQRFLRNPELRAPFIEKAKKRTLAQYTYRHRIQDLLAHMGV